MSDHRNTDSNLTTSPLSQFTLHSLKSCLESDLSSALKNHAMKALQNIGRVFYIDVIGVLTLVTKPEVVGALHMAPVSLDEFTDILGASTALLAVWIVGSVRGRSF